MSTFMFCGSGLELDIAGRAHGPLSRGDVVQINPLVTATADGYTTQNVDALNSGLSQVSLYGVVLGSNAKNTFAVGEDILIRIVGIVDVAMSGATTIGNTVGLTPGANNLTDTGGTAFQADAAASRVVGAAHTATVGAGIATCWFNGLAWG